MNSNQLEWRILNKEERDAYLETPYNPPHGDRAAFRSEWYGVYNEIMSALEKDWKYGVGDGDFFISSDCPPDRSMAVEISDERMIDRRAIAAVHGVVSRLERDIRWTYAMVGCSFERQREKSIPILRFLLKDIASWFTRRPAMYSISLN